MASFVATYNSSTGQPRNLTLKAADLVEAKRLLRRRGIKATELKAADTGTKNTNQNMAMKRPYIAPFSTSLAPMESPEA